MAKSTFELKTPMPTGTTREELLQVLHDHEAMIRLNPLANESKSIDTPPFASPEEKDQGFQWYEITDRVQYLPGGLWSSNIVYQACFRDSEGGLETHTYAPMGLRIVSKWRIIEWNGDERVLGIGVGEGKERVWLKEEVEMSCSVFLMGFVKRTMMRAHRDMAKLAGEKAWAMVSSGK